METPALLRPDTSGKTTPAFAVQQGQAGSRPSPLGTNRQRKMVQGSHTWTPLPLQQEGPKGSWACPSTLGHHHWDGRRWQDMGLVGTVLPNPAQDGKHLSHINQQRLAPEGHLPGSAYPLAPCQVPQCVTLLTSPLEAVPHATSRAGPPCQQLRVESRFRKMNKLERWVENQSWTLRLRCQAVH